MRWVAMLFFLTSFNILGAQESEEGSFEVLIGRDSILDGNYFEVRFTAHNLKGRFVAPDWDEMQVVGGPNQSSSMQMINGHTSQKTSITYFLKVPGVGNWTIPPAYWESEDQTWETGPVDIICLPNPEGVDAPSMIEQDANTLPFSSFFDMQKPPRKKKKLKETKI